MAVRCPRCATTFTPKTGRSPACPKCGYTAALARTAAPPRPATPQIPRDPGYAALGGAAPIFVQAKPSWSRPGSVTGAAVVAFVVAGLVLFGAIGWFTAGQVAGDFNDAGLKTGNFRTEATIYGIADLVIAIALVLGAIGALGRQSWGRIVLIIGAGCDLAFSLYMVALQAHYFDIMFIVMDVVIIALMLVRSTTTFFATPNPMRAGQY